ncbi:MAG: DUF4976 domain-containing protein [Pirellulales bacterium]
MQRPVYELYDTQNDPGETKNLADDNAHAETLATLQAKLKAHQKRTDDPWVIKYEHE